MPEPTIPADATAITEAWLTDVLRHGGAVAAASVTAFESAQIGAGVGIMGELFRVTPTYDVVEAGAPAAVIVKFPSPFEANRAQGVGLGMYEAEIRFYDELAASTPVRTPRCYFAKIVPGTAEFVVVLEDLGGLSMADQVEGMSVAQAEAAVHALASLHATWWGKVGDLEWVPSVIHPRIQMMASIWPDVWAAFVPKFGDRLPVGGIEAGEQIRDNYWSIMSRLGELPWTLLHQDCRCENLFFDDLSGPDPVVIIDWQAIGRGPGAYDLAYILGGSLTVADRRANEERIVRSYLGRLHDLGVTDYEFDDLWTHYRLGHLVNTATPVLTGGTFDLANERGKNLIGTLAERHFSAVVDLDCVALLP